MTSEHTKAYLAGLIDGEGCISLALYKKALGLSVIVGMTERSPIDLLSSTYGGRVKVIPGRTARHRQVFDWRIFGFAAEKILRDIEPHLLVKREQCALALETLDYARSGGMLSPWFAKDHEHDAVVLAYRDNAKTKMHQLKRPHQEQGITK